jgi:HTH-type transcriptional regulator, competence development regulator
LSGDLDFAPKRHPGVACNQRVRWVERWPFGFQTGMKVSALSRMIERIATGLRWGASDRSIGEFVDMDQAHVYRLGNSAYLGVTLVRESFGQHIRKKREEKGLGLREMARKVNISPTYLSRVETDEEKTPPGEETLRAIAGVLGMGFDELMHLAGRVPSDVGEMIKNDPDLPQFLRTARDQGLTGKKLGELLGHPAPGKRGR